MTGTIFLSISAQGARFPSPPSSSGPSIPSPKLLHGLATSLYGCTVWLCSHVNTSKQKLEHDLTETLVYIFTFGLTWL